MCEVRCLGSQEGKGFRKDFQCSTRNSNSGGTVREAGRWRFKEELHYSGLNSMSELFCEQKDSKSKLLNRQHIAAQYVKGSHCPFLSDSKLADSLIMRIQAFIFYYLSALALFRIIDFW